ncbi:helix-turn-helix domain-containing protein [Caldilinea sp.]|uniref:helix-turn-helix domain-containing protein n=1 Tax=Caldilinea sp. TaxID=2293560 RepID=UPI002C3B01ED|nr:helix-turn-helix domain-containing protein [Caldilinea sp.]
MSFERITAVLDCYHVELSPSERLVLVVLAHYENSRTGRCNPSQAAIATRVNLTERHVNRLLQGLRERGLIAFVDGRGGRNVSNHYTITIPANPDISDTLSGEETLTPVSGLQNKTLTSTAETLTWVHKNPDMGVLRIRKNKEEQGIAKQ